MTDIEKIDASLDLLRAAEQMTSYMADYIPLMFDPGQPYYMREAYHERYLHCQMEHDRIMEKLNRTIWAPSGKK